MSEQDVRDAFRAAVADEPPLAVDPDALVERVRRERRRRRSIWSTGAGVALVAALAVGIPTALGGKAGTGVAPPAAQRSVDPAPQMPTSRAAVDYSVENLRRRGKEMRVHLQRRLPAVVPGVQGVHADEFGGEVSSAASPGQSYLNAFVRFTVGGLPTAVHVQVNGPDADGTTPGRLCARLADTTCSQRPQGDGTVLVLAESPALDRLRRQVTAYHARRDGQIVMVTGYNYNPTGTGPGTVLPTVPLTAEQLTTLATDPALHL